MNNARALIVTILVLLFFVALVIKLVDVQIFKNDELSYYAKRQQTNIEKIKAERGFVYDRNNVLLEYNRNDISFYVDLRMLPSSQKNDLAKLFSKTFGKSKSHYLSLLKQSGKTICLEKKAPYEKAAPLLNYKLDALFYKEDPTRIYHYGSFASHVLGYVDNDYTGVNGIAKTFEDELNGEDGARLVEKNAIGDIIAISEDKTKLSAPGNDIYLTINKTYQAILEEELEKGLELYKGESAVGIIMDPNTGEILALTNTEDFDPNSYWEFNDFQRKNRAITDSYEPGSTFKAISLAAMLDDDVCNENEVINVENGVYKFRNNYIRDTHKFEKLSVRGIIEESSNIGIAKLIQRLDDETYYQYVRGFGFGTFTSVKLPGEVTGKLRKPADWSKLTKTYMSFGYGISATPLQLTTAFCALINGGTLYKPLIVKKEVSKDGRLIKEYTPVTVRNVISEKTSKRMQNLLKGVVEEGTGVNAKVDFISVGGKTGTSKLVVNGRYTNKYNSSFIGFFPADNPKVVCYILINNPKNGYYGGYVASPIFKVVAERIIHDDPDRFFDEDYLKQNDIKIISKTNAQINMNQNEVQNIFTNTKLNAMPDLKGKTVKEALMVLNNLGIKYNVSGSGVIIGQSIEPGSMINKNKICYLNCSEILVGGTRIY